MITALLAMVSFGLVAWWSSYQSDDLCRPLELALSAVSEYCQGDLRRSLSSSRQDQLGELLNSLEKLRAAYRAQIQQVQAASESNHSAAQNIQASASEVAEASLDMARGIAEATYTVEDVRQTALTSEQKAKVMAETAQEAAQVAAQGQLVTQMTQQEMEQVRSTMDSIAESILQLSGQSVAIANLIGSVNDLAEQSNVLAVNASIEAAKAGEFGRGFAVVAQEVKSLADESKQATNQVRAILQEIERSTSAAVMVAEQGSKTTQTALKQATEAGDAIRSLGGRVVLAAQSAAQISVSSATQLTGMEQVTEAMKGIREGSSLMAPCMSRLSDLAAQLEDLSARLNASVEGYQL
ncbi:hypothetical protein JST97_28260 [bacterium]|nr:hypothetical protein [bacterium]